MKTNKMRDKYYNGDYSNRWDHTKKILRHNLCDLFPLHSIFTDSSYCKTDVYFNQLSSACSTWKLVKTLFQPFSTFFVNFKPFSVISWLKSTFSSENNKIDQKRRKKGKQKHFNQLSGVHAPISWSKYTTDIMLSGETERLVLFFVK